MDTRLIMDVTSDPVTKQRPSNQATRLAALKIEHTFSTPTQPRREMLQGNKVKKFFSIAEKGGDFPEKTHVSRGKRGK